MFRIDHLQFNQTVPAQVSGLHHLKTRAHGNVSNQTAINIYVYDDALREYFGRFISQ